MNKAKIFLISILTSFWTFSLEITQASAEILVSNKAPKQGETIRVIYKQTAINESNSNTIPKLSFAKCQLQLFPLGRELASAISMSHTRQIQLWSCLLAIPADNQTGAMDIAIGSEHFSLQVTPGGFPLQHLNLPKSKDNFVMSAGEKEAVERAKNTVSNERYWQSSFQPPSKARQSARFGMKRVVNGVLLKDYFHSGLDFAAPLGSPVLATAPGKVVLAHNGFKLHGNVVAIDHGQGVISFYIHLQKILVNEGQFVKAGETIGKVGQTGRANGPHLHFSIYVNGTATNPIPWFGSSPQKPGCFYLDNLATNL